MVRRLFIIAVAASLALLATGAFPANAATPSNDDIANATLIGSVPYQNTQDTSEATVAASDPDVCVGHEATVWYSFTPASNGSYLISTEGSDYDTTLSVFIERDIGLGGVGCNDNQFGLQAAMPLDAAGGTTYLIMVGTCCGGDVGQVGPGGTLVLSVDSYPLTVSAPSVNKRITVSRLGVVHVSGTINCTPSSFGTSFWQVNVNLEQRLGRFVAAGGNSLVGECQPGLARWSLDFSSSTGTVFGGGKATLSMDSSAFDDITYVYGPSATVQVKLVRKA